MTGNARQGTVQRVGQVIALAGVAALLALLVWKVAFGNEDGAADELAKGKAAVGVLAPWDEAGAIDAALTELGGVSEVHAVSDEALEDAAAAPPASA